MKAIALVLSFLLRPPWEPYEPPRGYEHPPTVETPPPSPPVTDKE